MKLLKIIDKKNNFEQIFEKAFQAMIKDTEQKSKQILSKYFYAKKIRTIQNSDNLKQLSLNQLQLREKKSGLFKKELTINQILEILDEELIRLQMNLTQRLRNSFSKMEIEMNNIFDELNDIILGNEGLKKMEQFLFEFFSNFQKEAIDEAEKHEKVNS